MGFEAKVIFFFLRERGGVAFLILQAAAYSSPLPGISLAPPHGSHLGTPPSGDTWPCLEAFLVDTAERVLLAPSRWGPGLLQTCWGAQGAPQQRSSPEGQRRGAVGGQRRPGLLRGAPGPGLLSPSPAEPCVVLSAVRVPGGWLPAPRHRSLPPSPPRAQCLARCLTHSRCSITLFLCE